MVLKTLLLQYIYVLTSSNTVIVFKVNQGHWKEIRKNSG